MGRAVVVRADLAAQAVPADEAAMDRVDVTGLVAREAPEVKVVLVAAGVKDQVVPVAPGGKVPQVVPMADHHRAIPNGWSITRWNLTPITMAS